jgi:hypothetical protein
LAFNAWVTIRTDRLQFMLTKREATEAAYGLVQALCRWYGEIKSLTPGGVQQLVDAGGERLLEYDAMWKSGIEKHDLGAFFLHAYTCVQAEFEPSRGGGFIDHAASFGLELSRLEQDLKATL